MGKSTIGDAIAATLGEDVSTVDTSVQLIPLDDLTPNPRNFYPSPDINALIDLADSICANGLLEPLIVTPLKKHGYRIISGHSRWRAMSLPRCRTECPALIKAVPCLVLPPMSEEREMCAIIEANHQRVKNAATLAEEAERLTAAYVKRKEAGEELKGRVRDRVAEALKVSASKLAMAQATREHLTLPGFQEQWRGGKIPDTVAYEISKMKGDHQYRLLDWCINHGREAGSLKVAEVKALEEQFNSRPREHDLTREQEDALFAEAMPLLTRNLRADFSQCKTRAEAIEELRKRNNSLFVGSPKTPALCCFLRSVTIRNGPASDAPQITRRWADVYDAMALAALREAMLK